jgi:hypothetical protein
VAIVTKRLRYGSTGAVGINDTVYRELYRVYDDEGNTLTYDVALAYMQGTFPILTPGPNDTVVDRVEHRQVINESSHWVLVRYRKNIPFGGSTNYARTEVSFREDRIGLPIVAAFDDAISGAKFVHVPDEDKKWPSVPYHRVTAIRKVRKTIIGSESDPDQIADTIHDAVGGLYNVPAGGGRLYLFTGGSVVNIGSNESVVEYQFESRARIPEITEIGGYTLPVPLPELAALQEYRIPSFDDPDPVVGVIPAEDIYETDPPVLP